MSVTESCPDSVNLKSLQTALNWFQKERKVHECVVYFLSHL